MMLGFSILHCLFFLHSSKSPARFKLGRQSSIAPESRTATETITEDDDEELAAASAGIVDPTIRLMYLAKEGDIDGLTEMLASGTNVAACQGRTDVVQLLLSRGGAKVDSMDRWGSTPLADAVCYKNHDVIQLLEKHVAIPPTHVLTDGEVPEYEIHSTELDFSKGEAKIQCCWWGKQTKQMIEGYVPFHLPEETEVPKAYVEGERPPFNALAKSYPFGLRELIQECWDNEASTRPTFREIISVLELISD